MGETRKDALRLDFDRRLKLEFHGIKITSDAGLRAEMSFVKLDGKSEVIFIVVGVWLCD